MICKFRITSVASILQIAQIWIRLTLLILSVSWQYDGSFRQRKFVIQWRGRTLYLTFYLILSFSEMYPDNILNLPVNNIWIYYIMNVLCCLWLLLVMCRQQCTMMLIFQPKPSLSNPDYSAVSNRDTPIAFTLNFNVFNMWWLTTHYFNITLVWLSRHSTSYD